MKVAENYLSIIDGWDKLACEQHWADGWVDSSSTAIATYLKGCVENKNIPTFKGFMLHLSQVAPRE